MNHIEIKEALEKQLRLLLERSAIAANSELPGLTEAVCRVIRQLSEP